MKKSIIFSLLFLCIIIIIVVALLKNDGQKQSETTQTISTTTTTVMATIPDVIESSSVLTSVEITEKQDSISLQKEKYYKILDLYFDVLTDKVEIEINNSSVCYLCMPYFRGEKPLENIGYRITDLNNDGNLELIIGTVSYADFYSDMIFDMYTIIDGDIERVLVSGERSRFFLCENNYIRNEGSSGAAYSVYFLYKFNGTKLNVVEHLYSDGDNESYYTENNLSPWFLSKSREENPQVDRHLTQEEAMSKIQEYKDRQVPLELKPFKTYR